MDLIQIDSIKPWIEKKCRHLLSYTDDITENFIFEQIKEKTHPHQIQLHLTSYFGKENGAIFANQIWCLLISAEKSVESVPDPELIKKFSDFENAKQLTDEHIIEIQ
ncbi:MAG: Serine/arginine repetitive matrix protein 1 [Marteilia pararefringens]